ncbi:MAG TPA: LysM peptidoglycan-binding domain-containing protein [Ilumatobacteraceae bacterium]|nr:LysM peptidoglycan-binding domain-containing protein [Ilumatobacteraceae bacterium]
MNGVRLAVLVGVAIVLPVVVGACGDDGKAEGTLPPIVTVSTTTTIYVTTTTIKEYYIVKKGDTLGKIAKAFQVRLADIMAINGITNADDIQAGQELRIPTGAVVYNTLPTPVTTPSNT